MATKNPQKLDPTRTTTLRRAFIAEMNKRFRALRGALRKLIETDDVFGLKPSTTATINAEVGAWKFLTDDQKLGKFQSWFQTQVDANILSVDAMGQPWTAKYVDSAYKKGTMKSFTDAHKVDLLKEADFVEGTREQFLRSSFAKPERVSKLKMLGTRTFTELKGVTAAMDQQITRALVDGMSKGLHPHEIARNMNKSVEKLTKTRARVIARTEIIHAHSEGQLDAFEDLGVEQVGVEVEWQTARDDLVCAECERMEGEVMSVSDARGLIPLHPNCLTANTKVLSPDALAILHTHYTGEIINLVTIGGRRLSITPAHVLLTEFGFARAEAIHEGCNLFVDSGMYDKRGTTPNDDNRMPTIADEFISALESGEVSTISVPTSAKYLHNEGRFCDKEIHIVFSDGVLWDDGKFKVTASGVEETFPFCKGGIAHPALSTFAKRLFSVAHSSDSSMGGSRDLLALLLGHVLKAKGVGLAPRSRTQPSIYNPFVDCSAADVEALCQCFDGHPTLKQLDHELRVHLCSLPRNNTSLTHSLIERIIPKPISFADTGDTPTLFKVQTDQVLNVHITHVTDLPVYDVTSTSTVYSANGIISSNCRCAFIPYLGE